MVQEVLEQLITIQKVKKSTALWKTKVKFIRPYA